MAVACLGACSNVVRINDFSLPLKDEISNLVILRIIQSKTYIALSQLSWLYLHSLLDVRTCEYGCQTILRIAKPQPSLSPDPHSFPGSFPHSMVSGGGGGEAAVTLGSLLIRIQDMHSTKMHIPCSL